MVRHRLRILHTKTAEQYLRIAIRRILTVFVGIEKKIWRLHHEHAAVTESDAGAEIEIANEILELVGATVAIGVFHNRYTVGAFWTAWRWLRYPVVNCAGIAVHADPLQSGRV